MFLMGKRRTASADGKGNANAAAGKGRQLEDDQLNQVSGGVDLCIGGPGPSGALNLPTGQPGAGGGIDLCAGQPSATNNMLNTWCSFVPDGKCPNGLCPGDPACATNCSIYKSYVM